MSTNTFLTALGNAVIGLGYSYLSQKSPVLSSIDQKTQMTAFLVSVMTQVSLDEYYDNSVRDRESQNTFFNSERVIKHLLPYMLIGGANCYSNRSAVKTNFISTALLGTAQLVIGKISANFTYNQINDAPFGDKEWKEYFKEIGAFPNLPANIEDTLNQECPFNPGKKVGETHTLTLIPKTVGGRNFNLDLLAELVENPKKGYQAQIYYEGVKAERGQKQIDESYWVLVLKEPKDVLSYILSAEEIMGEEKQFNMDRRLAQTNYTEPREMLQKLNKKIPISTEYRLPNTLEAATVILTHHIRKGEAWYETPFNFRGYTVPTYAWCSDKTSSSSHQIVLGEFNKKSLFIANVENAADLFGYPSLSLIKPLT